MLLRAPLLGLSRSTRVRQVVERTPLSRSVVNRYVAGSTTDDAVRATRVLVDSGLKVTLDHLGEDTLDAEQADCHAGRLRPAPLGPGRRGSDHPAPRSPSSSRRSGRRWPATARRSPSSTREPSARRPPMRAPRSPSTWRTTPPPTRRSAILHELRKDFPSTGAVLQAYLRGPSVTAATSRRSASRVRLCKGAYDEPESVAYRDRDEVDKSYVRCLRVLMAGQGLPDDRHARPAPHRRGGRAGGTQRPAARRHSSTRCCTAYAPTSRSAWPGRARRSASTCRTARSGTATSYVAWRRSRPTSRCSLRSLVSRG